MNQIIFATFEDGVLKPEGTLALPSGTRVRLTVELLGAPETGAAAWQDLEQLWEEASVDSGCVRFTRDELPSLRPAT